tara:strand:- start:249 stop:701 length:453 start_codon:yes stop_codon:yes gene_type:complete
MDITSQVSVLSVVIEVVTLTLGLQVVTLSLRDVVSSLVQWVETLVWETMLVHHTGLMVGTVTVTITTMQCLQVLHLSELLVFHTVLEDVGFVVVAGLFLMDTVDKVVSLHTVVVAIVDKVDKVEEDSLRSLTSKSNIKILEKRVLDPLFL